MDAFVQKFYKDLYDIATTALDADDLGICPTHFVGEKSNFKKGLPMFIGRDTNGLGQNKIPLIKDYEVDTLEWLKEKDGYYYNVSPFWRVIGHSLEQIRKEKYSADIFHDFYWSDLYKINFRTKQGITLHWTSYQINVCYQLLLAEMDDLNPSVSIFLTGIDGFKGVHRFIERWRTQNQLTEWNANTGKFTLLGKNGEHRCIVLPHPQGKAESDIVLKIVDFYNSLR